MTQKLVAHREKICSNLYQVVTKAMDFRSHFPKTYNSVYPGFWGSEIMAWKSTFSRRNLLSSYTVTFKKIFSQSSGSKPGAEGIYSMCHSGTYGTVSEPWSSENVSLAGSGAHWFRLSSI